MYAPGMVFKPTRGVPATNSKESSMKWDIVDYFVMADALVYVIKECLPTVLTLDEPKEELKVEQAYMTEFIKDKLSMIEHSKELLEIDCPVLFKLSICNEEMFMGDTTENTNREEP